MANFNDVKNLDLEKIISKKKIGRYHKEFSRIKSSDFLKRLMFLRMHLNRVIQSVFIILSNPFIWHFVFSAFINSIRGRKVLRSLEVAVTYRCNSSCSQCSCRADYDKYKEENLKLTMDEFKDAIDQAVEMGAFQFSINGGEPLLEEDTVFELIRYIKKYHKRFVMLCTNGSFLTEDKIARLKECGLDGVEMGFDSAFQQDHDKNRVKGSYQRILRNINLCKKHRLLISLNTILTNEKVGSDDIIYTVTLAKKLGCLLQITPCCLTGAFKNRLDLLLTEEAKLYFFWLLSKTFNNRSDMYSGLTVVKCPAATEKMCLQPYGDVVSCSLIQLKYGNMRKNRLKDIQEEMLKNPYYNSKKMQGCLPSMCEPFIREYLINK